MDLPALRKAMKVDGILYPYWRIFPTSQDTRESLEAVKYWDAEMFCIVAVRDGRLGRTTSHVLDPWPVLGIYAAEGPSLLNDDLDLTHHRLFEWQAEWSEVVPGWAEQFSYSGMLAEDAVPGLERGFFDEFPLYVWVPITLDPDETTELLLRYWNGKNDGEDIYDYSEVHPFLEKSGLAGQFSYSDWARRVLNEG